MDCLSREKQSIFEKSYFLQKELKKTKEQLVVG
jgi:hypothetical protein